MSTKKNKRAGKIQFNAELPGTNPDEMRNYCIQNYFLPIATQILDTVPRANTVAFAIAQYWDDEGEDAVHGRIVCSTHESKVWNSFFDAEKNKFVKSDEEENEVVSTKESVAAFRELENTTPIVSGEYIGNYSGFFKKIQERVFGDEVWLDDNGSMVEAFAAFCKEDCNQEMSHKDSYSPYAFLVRTPEGYKLSVIEKSNSSIQMIDPAETAAMNFAVKAHGEQKYGDEPYFFHLTAVRQVLTDFNISGDLGVAAWLHDVLEDTATTSEEMTKVFGTDVYNLVWAVTGTGKNRKERTASAYSKLKELPLAITLKLADRIANVESSLKNNPQLFQMYKKEMETFQSLRQYGGDERLWKRLIKSLNK